MNEQLKFSWGHIIAFLALIILSYMTFIGVTYKTEGDFAKATVTMVIVVVVLFTFFIGSQMMKATTHKFAKRIWIERFLVFASPIAFVICSMPYFHFGTVQSHNADIVKDFTDAITASNQMFIDYDNYAAERINNYEKALSRVIANKTSLPDDFASCGFKSGQEEIQKSNMVKALRLQLISENYDSLKNEAIKWIETSSHGASTWNVFLLGNTKEIKKAIHNWNDQLIKFANHKMNNEEINGYNNVKLFGKVSSSLNSVDQGLNGLTTRFIQSAFPPVGYILFAIIIYLALLFPYFLQDRHTKSQYRLIGMEKGALHASRMTIDTINPAKDSEKRDNGIPIESYEDETSASNQANPNENDDYASFTM